VVQTKGFAEIKERDRNRIITELTALARKSGVRLYVDLRAGNEDPKTYRELGFAGYLSEKEDRTYLFNFLSARENTDEISAGIIDLPKDLEARKFPDALKKALSSSQKEFKVVRLAQIADYLRQERSIDGRMAITDILRMPVLSIFTPEQINEAYVRRVAYHWDRERLPSSEEMIDTDAAVQTYLIKLQKGIAGTGQNYGDLEQAFKETIKERVLAKVVLAKDMNGAALADEDMERALGYLLRVQRRDTQVMPDRDFIDNMTNDDRRTTEEVLAAIGSYVAQVRQKKERTDVEVATAIELLTGYAERKHAGTVKKKEQRFDARTVKAILGAA
jgi:RNase H-fold protein (predicted Holliday junction resolvase)